MLCARLLRTFLFETRKQALFIHTFDLCNMGIWRARCPMVFFKLPCWQIKQP